MSNPEDKVLDAIDELVDWQLAHEDDETWIPEPRCAHCGDDWHGQPYDYGCPGAFADDDTIAAWRTECETWDEARRTNAAIAPDAITHWGGVYSAMLRRMADLLGVQFDQAVLFGCPPVELPDDPFDVTAWRFVGTTVTMPAYGPDDLVLGGGHCVGQLIAEDMVIDTTDARSTIAGTW